MNAVVAYEEISLLLLFIDWTECFIIISFLTNETIVFNGKYPGNIPAGYNILPYVRMLGKFSSSLFAMESQLQFICTRLKCVSLTRGFILMLKRETVKICNNMAINLTYLLCCNNAVVRNPLMGEFSWTVWRWYANIGWNHQNSSAFVWINLIFAHGDVFQKLPATQSWHFCQPFLQTFCLLYYISYNDSTKNAT